MRLKELAIKYSSDKLYAHSYIERFYEQEFANRKPRTLLEIGIGYRSLMEPFVPEFVRHSSLKMWRDYFPDCYVYGTDIHPYALGQNNVGYATLCSDQSRPTDLLRLIDIVGRPDIIIDDGSHQTEHQIISAITLLPYLRKGGIYVIEDVQEPKKILSEIRHPSAASLKYDKRPDDCLVVFYNHD